MERARSLEPEGTEFNARLHADYIDLAETEGAKHGWLTQREIAERAIAAAKGLDVPPFDPDAAGVPPDEADELLRARARLLAALRDGAPTAWSQQAARAQVMYDCWVLQKANANTPADTAACRGAFFASISAVERAIREREAALDPSTKPPPTPTYFAIYFDAGNSKLTADAVSALADAASAAERLEPHRVTVLGYASAAGVTPVTDLLARERANTVAKELGRLGVDEKLLAVHSYRAGKLFVGSGGESAEPPSTRVDIMLEK